MVVDADPRDDSVEAVWDSGLFETDQSFDVPYAGEPLKPRTRYCWAVRVVDEAGNDSGWSEPATFETGLFDEEGWREGEPARWIESPTEPGAEGSVDLDAGRAHQKIERIWTPRYRRVPAGSVVRFRSAVTLPDGTVVEKAELVADGGRDVPVRARVNDTEVSAVGDDVAKALAAGENVVTIDVGPVDGESALVARLDIAVADGDPIVLVTNGSWECAVGDEWILAESRGLHGWPPLGRSPLSYRPSPCLRKHFEISAPIRKARLYATALGLYEARINGQRVGDQHFTPGWTDYAHRLQYQIYDVTEYLSTGANVLGAVLADGWYAGNVGWYGQFQYGDRRAFRARLEVEYEDGSTSSVVSDGTWRVGESEIRFADLQQGEVVDRRSEPVGWDTVTFDDRGWAPAVVVEPSHGPLEAQISPPIRVLHTIEPSTIEQREPGRYIVDFG
ncbi:MAG TPA: alpha-L-rhamnosidase N-terminal domain-containing protein, partial [Actinopolymorphaceae bacterium]